MRSSQAANPITGEVGSVHPIGHPIIISPKRGFKAIVNPEDASPGVKVTRTGGEDREAPTF